MGGVLAYAWGVGFVLPYLFMVGTGEAAAIAAKDIPSIAVDVLGDLVLVVGILIGASLMLLFKSITLGLASFFMILAAALLVVGRLALLHNLLSEIVLVSAAIALGCSVFYCAYRDQKKNRGILTYW